MSYFRWEFEELTRSMREQVIMPVLSKLRPFESNTHLLACFGQPQSSLDPLKAVREGKILLVRSGAAVLSQEYSNFIGSLLLNLVRRAIFAQAELPPEERTPVTVIVDESQSFTGVDYAAAIAQIAKFGGNLILTTQGTRFIGRSTASDEPDDAHAFTKILANVDTLLVYRISGEDAVALAETEFVGELAPSDLIYLPDYQAFVRFKRDGQVIGPFRVAMDPPPPADPGAAAAVLAGRSRYCLPLSEALEGARRSSERLWNFYGTPTSAQTAAVDGEIQAAVVDEAGGELGQSELAPPPGTPPGLESLIADGVGLDHPGSPAGLAGLLDSISSEYPPEDSGE